MIRQHPVDMIVMGGRYGPSLPGNTKKGMVDRSLADQQLALLIIPELKEDQHADA